ncbi:E3 ubiquitin-protein ligase rnf13 [Coemansia sp. Benny D160-2]|nr:E3 ubiquitin-protein ligase rnf13 [Coemansia sp. Benny D160-2]
MNLVESVVPMSPSLQPLPHSTLENTSGASAGANDDTSPDRDVEMTDVDGEGDEPSQAAASEVPSGSRSASSSRRSNRMVGGDMLLARIIGRSIVDTVAREMEENRPVLTAADRTRGRDSQQSGSGTNSENFFFHSIPTAPAATSRERSTETDPSGQQQQHQSTSQSPAPESDLPMYNMGFSSRIALYRDVARFILSILVSDLDNENSSRNNGNDQDRPNFEYSFPLRVQNEPPAPLSNTDYLAPNTANTSSTSPAQENAAADASSSTNTSSQPSQQGARLNAADLLRTTRMHYRMFLLPDAIDQTLEHYERRNSRTEPSNGSDDASTSSGNSETVDSPVIASLNSVIDRIDNRVSQPSEPLSSSSPPDQGATRTTSSILGEATARTSGNELLRTMRQREREEKLRRLRSMVRAMGDERRFLPVPVVILGMQLSGELHQEIRSRFGVPERTDMQTNASQPSGDTADTLTSPVATAANVDTSSSSSSSTQRTSADIASAASASRRDGSGSGDDGGVQGILRGIRTRVGQIVPSIVGGLAAWRRHGRNDLGAAASAANTSAGGSDDGVSNADAEPAAAQPTSGESNGVANNSADDGPMMSAYLTIQYTQLGNPLLLHIVASTLFSDLLGDAGSDGRAGSSTSGNDYEILTELSNIIGQVMSNTVSQDLVNKKLAKYRYEGIVGGETKDGKKNTDVFARLIVDDDDVEEGAKLDGDVQSVVKLVSADRCSVCLEDFKVGEVLRVLGCHHALHLPCGDSWFTQGSNMCPICRSEAVSTGAR